MSKAPWFKFYAADYMSSLFVQSLEPEQELWYVRLIIASAINLPRGCLPFANGKLWRLAKAPSLEHFEKHCGPILAKFERDEESQLYRVPKVADQQLLSTPELSRKRAEAGKQGAAKRWQVVTGADDKLPSRPMANVKQKIADSDSDSDSEEKRLRANALTTPTRASQMPDAFVPSAGHKALARELGVDLEGCFAAFQDHHLAKGSKFKDWNRALNIWLRNENKFRRSGTPMSGKPVPIANVTVDNPSTRTLAAMAEGA